jgi:hypothetical protein
MTLTIGKICPFSELINPHNDCLEAATELEGEILEALTHLKLSNILDDLVFSGAIKPPLIRIL